MEIKSRSEIEARKELISGADQAELQAQESIRSSSKLKNLDEYSLADQYESIDNQATLLKWEICMYIRDKFISDRKMGEFLNELREKNSSHALCRASQQDINRSIYAGRFCAKHRIYSLESAGILISNVYELSRPINGDIADNIYAK
jgi:hypothetical protein